MMKFMLVLIFMFPLVFLKKSFWFMQGFYFILTLLFCFNISMTSQFSYITYFMGCDLLSYIMILLSFWICSLMLLASEKVYNSNYYYNLFLLLLLVLMICLFVMFSSLNLFVFYLFFEMSLIPILILIMGWGYQPERLQAGVYLLFYTLFASLPMMISLFYYYECYNTLDFFYLINLLDNVFIYMCMNMVFFIKMPMYFVHLWLPKAHVEAPVAGSMILAGVMLKMGGYGLMRLMSVFLSVGVKINIIFIIISMVGGFLVSLICLRQSDMKSLIAYSSVAHMGLVLGGIMTLSYWGMCGALVMMVAHGLCSSGLFCLANISYERLLSRSLFLNKGLLNLMPLMSMWWFLFSCCNMAAPPSLNLLGEIMLINSLVSWSSFLMVFLMLISFFSAAYSLYLYSYSQHGMMCSSSYSYWNGSVREYLLLFLHWFPLNVLVLKSEYITLWV
uniref:NADH dehydrogenase subunit 4 n=1 Tax=Clinterocera nigra TaxID=2921222 RepID=UPI0020019079|nr:NADH dehydrogenase subunit 4 [Clinterocera nigra]UNZ13010.1 NADH dehydrogenase subunit 4 [Clinterocera nigra]UNZ13023.1 NADH dehydrogenase subunit 4 [Clinterocera nigra]UNZ13036.1 NADH dehydrogenase subunit 4 [Clinterocera nigra]